MDDSTTITIVPATAQPTALDGLCTQICEGLARHEQLVRDCVSRFIDTAENSVRLGSQLSDARDLVISAGGKWGAWVEENLSISQDRARRLQRLSAYFCRDLIDYQRRKSSGLELAGLSAGIGKHLREQLAESEFRSQNEMWRTLGLKAASPTQPSGQRPKVLSLAPVSSTTTPPPAVHQRNGDHDEVTPVAMIPVVTLSPLEQTIESLKEAHCRLEKLDLGRLSPPEKMTLHRWLTPLVRYYGRSSDW
jgi:hypothetical protein